MPKIVQRAIALPKGRRTGYIAKKKCNKLVIQSYGPAGRALAKGNVDQRAMAKRCK